jgi:hypothetical protein
MDVVVELVVVIPTSPRSSKTESECKSYSRFLVDVFFRAGNSAPGAGISGGGRKFHNFRPCEILLRLCLDVEIGAWNSEFEFF